MIQFTSKLEGNSFLVCFLLTTKQLKILTFLLESWIISLKLPFKQTRSHWACFWNNAWGGVALLSLVKPPPVDESQALNGITAHEIKMWKFSPKELWGAVIVHLSQIIHHIIGWFIDVPARRGGGGRVVLWRSMFPLSLFIPKAKGVGDSVSVFLLLTKYSTWDEASEKPSLNDGGKCLSRG